MDRSRVVLAILLAGVLVAGCKGFGRDKSKTEAGVEAISVEAVAPERRTLAETVQVTGNLEPIEKADVYAQQSGIVREVYAIEGDKVKKDQLLAKIDDNEISISYRQAKNSYELLREKYSKYLELYREKMVSEQEFKDLERSYKDAESNYRLYSIRLSNTQLRSPINGEVVSRSCEPHQFLGGMEKAFTVARLDNYKVTIFVTEASLRKLKLQQDVAIRIDAVDSDTAGYPHRGYIAEIAAQVDASTGTAKVEVTVPEPPNYAKPGMFARLKIITALKTDVLTIPKKALAREEPPEVWVVKGNKVELRQVQTGLEDEAHMEITAGVVENELVVTAGQEALSDKSKVRVVNLPVAPESSAPGSQADKPQTQNNGAPGPGTVKEPAGASSPMGAEDQKKK